MRTKKIEFKMTLTIIAALITICGCDIKSVFEVRKIKGPMVVAICSDPKKRQSVIYCINPDNMRVINSIRLRTVSTSFAKDDNGLLYTAQRGVGPDFDNALGVVDVRSSRVERYIRLREYNPYEIVYEKGKLVINNGIMLTKSKNMVGEMLDIENDFESVPLELPGTICGQSLMLYKGKVYVSTLLEKIDQKPDEPPEKTIFVLNPKNNKATKLFSDLYFSSIAFDGNGIGYGLVPRQNTESWRNNPDFDTIVVFDPIKKKIVKKIELARQMESGYRTVFSQNKLYICFFDPTVPDQSSGNSIGILDLRTEKMRVIKGFRGPVSILPVNGKIYVGNYDNDTVVAVDEKTGKKLGSVKVGKWPEDMEYIE